MHKSKYYIKINVHITGYRCINYYKLRLTIVNDYANLEE